MCRNVAKNLKIKDLCASCSTGSLALNAQGDDWMKDKTLTHSFQQLVDAHYAVLNEAQFQVNCVLQTLGNHVSLIRLNALLPTFS